MRYIVTSHRNFTCYLTYSGHNPVFWDGKVQENIITVKKILSFFGYKNTITGINHIKDNINACAGIVYNMDKYTFSADNHNDQTRHTHIAILPLRFLIVSLALSFTFA